MQSSCSRQSSLQGSHQSSLQIALFGTSADPPTIGHQKILTWLSQEFDLVRVWASDNPFKQHPVALKHRTEMLKRCIRDLGPDIETDIGPNIGPDVGPSSHASSSILAVDPELSSPRSLITVERAKQRWPHATFTLVIGSDLAAQISSWYQAEALLCAVQLLIVPRPGFPLEASTLHWLRQRTSVTIAPIKGPAVSSTQYRQGNHSAVSPAVQAYIQHENLYSCPDPAPSAR